MRFSAPDSGARVKRIVGGLVLLLGAVVVVSIVPGVVWLVLSGAAMIGVGWLMLRR